MKIELTQNPSKEDAKIISGGLVQFNHETIPDLEPQEATINFSIFTRAAAGEITGGLRASCYWNILHIELKKPEGTILAVKWSKKQKPLLSKMVLNLLFWIPPVGRQSRSTKSSGMK